MLLRSRLIDQISRWQGAKSKHRRMAYILCFTYSHVMTMSVSSVGSTSEPACLLGCKPIVSQRDDEQLSSNPTPTLLCH